MKTLNKMSVVLLSAVVMVSLCACSAIDPNYGLSDTSSTETSMVKQSNYDENTKIMSSDRVMSTFFNISLFDEENYSEIYLGKKFEIEATYVGVTIPVPTKLNDMADIGWNLADGNEYNENSLVFSYETVDVVFQNAEGLKVEAQCYNSSRSSVKLSDCYVVKFRIENDFYNDNANYNPFNINGVTNTMAVTDVIEVLGTPSHFYQVDDNNYYLDYFLTKRDRRNGITVYVNPTDDIVTAVEFSFYK